MIAHLRGVVLEKSAAGCVLEVAGVGYLVALTAGALRGLPPDGSEGSLPVYTHFTAENGPQLFGFSDSVERRLFQTLITVKNIGPKAAINILSSVPGPDLVRAIVSGDLERLSAIKGVGRKTAERLCVELRDNIAAAAAAGSKRSSAEAARAGSGGSSLDPRLREVAAYLEALQLRPDEFAEHLPGLDPTRPLPDLVKDALAALRKARPGSSR